MAQIRGFMHHMRHVADDVMPAPAGHCGRFWCTSFHDTPCILQIPLTQTKAHTTTSCTLLSPGHAQPAPPQPPQRDLPLCHPRDLAEPQVRRLDTPPLAPLSHSVGWWRSDIQWLVDERQRRSLIDRYAHRDSLFNQRLMVKGPKLMKQHSNNTNPDRTTSRGCKQLHVASVRKAQVDSTSQKWGLIEAVLVASRLCGWGSLAPVCCSPLGRALEQQLALQGGMQP